MSVRPTPPIRVRTVSQLKKAIRDGDLTASLLRQPGFHRLGHEERKRIADLLEALAQASRRLFGPLPLPDVAPILHDQSAEPDATEDDLFGGAA